MSQEPEDDDLQPEYDFSGAVRGKYYERYQQGTNVILLDPDVAQAFKDSTSVNRALRLLLDLADLAREEVPQGRQEVPGTRPPPPYLTASMGKTLATSGARTTMFVPIGTDQQAAGRSCAPQEGSMFCQRSAGTKRERWPTFVVATGPASSTMVRLTRSHL